MKTDPHLIRDVAYWQDQHLKEARWALQVATDNLEDAIARKEAAELVVKALEDSRAAEQQSEKP